MRGEVNLDQADVVFGGDFGVGGMSSEGGDAKLSRSNESVEYWLAEAACGLCSKSQRLPSSISISGVRQLGRCFCMPLRGSESRVEWIE